MTNYLIGIAIGCCVTLVAYQFIPSKRLREKDKKLKKATEEKTRLEHENFELKNEVIRNRISINELREEMSSITLRQDQADQWFGSIIRHSRAQFDKQAVEEFLKEQGMEEEL